MSSASRVGAAHAPFSSTRKSTCTATHRALFCDWRHSAVSTGVVPQLRSMSFLNASTMSTTRTMRPVRAAICFGAEAQATTRHRLIEEDGQVTRRREREWGGD